MQQLAIELGEGLVVPGISIIYNDFYKPHLGESTDVPHTKQKNTTFSETNTTQDKTRKDTKISAKFFT